MAKSLKELAAHGYQLVKQVGPMSKRWILFAAILGSGIVFSRPFHSLTAALGSPYVGKCGKMARWQG